MEKRIYKSYTYKDKVYELNQYQLDYFKRARSLPKKNLHYIVCQQSIHEDNLTIKQMKSSIERAVRRYVGQLIVGHNPVFESFLVPYLCVFETGKEFHLNQSRSNLDTEDFDLGLHFHLFISSPDEHEICFETLSKRIEFELRAIKKKRECISKYDCRKVDKLNKPFICYHTKQLYRTPSREMILTNTA